MDLNFSLSKLQLLAIAVSDADINKSARFVPTSLQTYDGRFYPGGQPLDASGRTEGEVPAGGVFEPSASRMDREVPAMLQLVRTTGRLFLRVNVAYPSDVAHWPVVTEVDADGFGLADPNSEEDLRTEFGGDDEVYDLPIAWLHRAIESRRYLRVRCSDDALEWVEGAWQPENEPMRFLLPLPDARAAVGDTLSPKLKALVECCLKQVEQGGDKVFRIQSGALVPARSVGQFSHQTVNQLHALGAVRLGKLRTGYLVLVVDRDLLERLGQLPVSK
ncbi:hypothetical protein [Ferrimonas marina]|uniref:Uncharacterized protein n=1 Tax=Ferrimonas marina TaxID=299255 RepID=A0A1M5U8L3_9GAMM|nr:hypothetical protein [Ferrimonas marina]SHH59317.1 hypothetical protein SAMN02745129_2454 [Ferrimonas marina]